MLTWRRSWQNQKKSTDPIDMSPKISHKTLGSNGHNAVRTTGLLVHVSGRCGSILARILGGGAVLKMGFPILALIAVLSMHTVTMCAEVPRNQVVLPNSRHYYCPSKTIHHTFTLQPGVANAFQHIIHIVHRCFGKARDTTSSILIDAHIQLLLHCYGKSRIRCSCGKRWLSMKEDGSCNGCN